MAWSTAGGAVAFATHYEPEGVRLFELHDDVLKALKAGDTVSFKGGKGEDAVLCTATDTYSVCRVQTSNTCLLANMSHGSTAPDAAASAGAGGGAGAGSGGVVTPDGGGDEAAGDGAGTTGKPTFLVTSSVSSQHNVEKIAPQLHRIKELLEENPFTDERDSSDEEEPDLHTQEPVALKREKAYTFAELEALVQASPAEIAKGLTDLDAVEHNGAWRLLDTRFRDRLFDRLLDSINVECDSFDEVPGEVTVDSLAAMFPEFAVRHALQALASKRDDEPAYWKLSPEKVAKFRALLILRQVDTPSFALDAFMRAWHASLGRFTAAVELAKPELLTGNVLIDNTGDQPTIQLFQASSLSPIPRRRFDQLFAMRPRWQLEDLQPFVEPLVGGTVKLADLLLAFTRVTVLPDDAGTEYSARL